MSTKENAEVDIQLELRDRINYPHVLQSTLMNIKRALMNTDIDIGKIEDMMWDFFTDIPHSWYDEQFTDDVKKAFIQKTIDARPVWGDVRLSEETCKKYGMALTKTITSINIYLLKNAIINLLHRRDMLVRKKKIEYSTGKNLKITSIDELAKHEGQNTEDDDMLTSLPSDARTKDELDELEKSIAENGVDIK